MSQEKKVAERLRSYRENQGLSVAELAARSGIDEAVVQAIEAGEVIPVLGVLAKLAQTLGQRLGTFLDDQYKPDPIITRAADGEQPDDVMPGFVGRGYRARSLAPGKPDRQMDPYLLTLEPDCLCHESSHEGEEFVICVSGQLELAYGTERIVLNPGDTAYYNSIVKHTVRALGGEPATAYGVAFMPV